MNQEEEEEKTNDNNNSNILNYIIISIPHSFVIIYFQYKKYDGKFNDGYLFGIFLILIFGFRIFVEYFKENQTYFEEGMLLNMGQLLSIPLVIAGIYFLYYSKKKGSKIDN